MKVKLPSISKNPVESVAKKSAKILDVFTSTVNELKTVNNEINGHISTHEDEKRKIEENLRSLNQTKEDNNKVISKIEKIFE